ncbi:hypothetical protein D3C78_1891790 [compost metagenome]
MAVFLRNSSNKSPSGSRSRSAGSSISRVRPGRFFTEMNRFLRLASLRCSSRLLVPKWKAKSTGRGR